MKDILKVTLGILLAVAVCFAIALLIKVYFTPSAYERCNIACEAEANRFIPASPSADEYAEYMQEIMGCPGCEDAYFHDQYNKLIRHGHEVLEECLGECKGTWGLHDEFHWLMGITYIER